MKQMLDNIPDNLPHYPVFVSNLTYSTGEDELRALFSQVPGFLSVRLFTKSDGKRNGMGIVNYKTKQAGYDAIARFANSQFNGRTLRVEWGRELTDKYDVPRAPRPAPAPPQPPQDWYQYPYQYPPQYDYQYPYQYPPYQYQQPGGYYGYQGYPPPPMPPPPSSGRWDRDRDSSRQRGDRDRDRDGRRDKPIQKQPEIDTNLGRVDSPPPAKQEKPSGDMF